MKTFTVYHCLVFKLCGTFLLRWLDTLAPIACLDMVIPFSDANRNPIQLARTPLGDLALPSLSLHHHASRIGQKVTSPTTQGI